MPPSEEIKKETKQFYTQRVKKTRFTEISGVQEEEEKV